MLTLLLQAAQQAKEVAPQVYVTVQQPPPGMSEWVRIVISAGVGAIFGISGNVVMEFVKPIIQRGKARKQLVNEMVRYFAYVEVANDAFNRERETRPVLQKLEMVKGCKALFNSIDPQRFKYLTGNQQSVVYEIPLFDNLQVFYAVLGRIGGPSNYDSYDAFSTELSWAHEMGHSFLRKNSPRYEIDMYEAQSVVQDAMEGPNEGYCA